MENVRLHEQLDNAIGMLMTDPDLFSVHSDAAVQEWMEVASMLSEVPSPKFKARLATELAFAASSPQNFIRPTHHAVTNHAFDREFRPTLLEEQNSMFRAHGSNFAASLVLHAAGLALITSSGLWLAQQNLQSSRSQTVMLADSSEYTLPVAPDVSHGGGGGGDHDKLPARSGSPPRFAREQLSPPAIVVPNDNARLTVQPTVVGPPSINLTQGQLGDPLSAFVAPSNGPGSGSGIGTGSGGGVGVGKGTGVGAGEGGGVGGGAYRVGGGVSAPRGLFTPDPEYSEEARKAKYQGTVVLWMVIGTDGNPHNIRVVRSLGMGLDQKAVDTVRKWRFAPGTKDGMPVAVQINIEVSFRLY